MSCRQTNGEPVGVDKFSVVSIKRIKHVTNEVTLFNIFKNVDIPESDTWTCGPFAMTEAKGPAAFGKKLILVKEKKLVQIQRKRTT